MKAESRNRGQAWLRATALSPAILAALHVATVSATNLTWDPLQTTTGSDGPGNWDTTSTNTFWSNGSTDSVWNNANSDTAIFGSNTGPADTVTLTTPITASGLTFNNAASGNYTIAAAAPADTLTLSGTPSITADSGLSPTISAPIATSTGVSGVTFAGSGSINLSALNAYSATTFINSGTVTVQPGGSLGNPANTLSLSSGTGVTALDINTNVSVGLLAVHTNSLASAMNIAANQTLFANSGASFGTSNMQTPTELTIAGGGRLYVNSSFALAGGVDESGVVAVDLSGLNNFTCTVNLVSVGETNTVQATLTLANTNTITASTFVLGTAGRTPSTSGSGTINLGSGTNTIDSNFIQVYTGSLGWANTTTTGSLTIAGITGGISRAPIGIGNNDDSGIATSPGTLLLDGHSVNILASTLSVGNSSNSSIATGVVAFDTGTLDATSINMSDRASSGTATGTLTLGSSPSSTGTLIVNNPSGPGGGYFSLANSVLATTAANCNGTFDIKGGTANIYCDITVDVSPSTGAAGPSGTIILEGGTLNMHGHNIGSLGSSNVTLTTTSGTLENVNSIDTGGLTMTGSGLLTLDGVNGYTGGTTVSSGTLTLASTGSAISKTYSVAPGAVMNINGTFSTTTPLITDNGTLNFGPNPNTGILARSMFSLSIGAGANVTVAPATSPASRTVLRITTSPSFADATGSLDLTNNDMILRNVGASGLTTTVAQISQGLNTGTHGPWTGTGITSSFAAATPATTALAVELNDDGTGTPLMTTFDGQTVGDTDVLVKYTFVGDADLSGRIDATDYTLIDNGYASQSGLHPLSGWRNGDFNYDGIINGDDYTLIDNAFNTEGTTSYAATPASPAEMIASDTAQVAATSVPEPASFILIGIAGLLPRRRRN